MSNISVVSAIMGGGKSSGARNYCRYNQDQKFIYISPFLDESEKFAKDCPELNFAEPKHLEKYGWSKVNHISELVKEGRNIASTHSAFCVLPKETLEMISEKKYTLICDETTDAVNSEESFVKDMQILQKAGMLEKDGDFYRYTGNDDYLDGTSKYSDLCRLAKNNNIIFSNEELNGGTKGKYYYVLLPPELLLSFEKVIILTYLFKSSSMYALLEYYGIEYDEWGIDRVDFGTGYMLSESGTYVPEYVRNIKDIIHIYEYEDNPIIGRGRPPKNLNVYKVGSGKIKDDKYFEPTLNFFRNPKRYKELYDELKNNQRNFFDKLIKQHGGSRESCMWGTYKEAVKKLESRGLRNKFVPFNKRATNEFRHKTYLSYICAPHIRPQLKNFYARNGIDFDERQWALSTATQWVWRSACRDGKEVWLYCPSYKLRTDIHKWLDDLSNGIVLK